MAVVLGINALGEGDSSPAVPAAPRIANLRLLENTPGSGRADDLRRVRVAFDLVDEAGASASVALQASPGADDRYIDATPADGPLVPEGSGAGTARVLTWNAEADGVRGYRMVSLRVVPRDTNGRGIESILRDAAVGNDAPVVDRVEVVGSPERDSVGQNVVVRFSISDSAKDPVDLELHVSTDGGSTFQRVAEEHIIAGRTRRVLPGQSDLTWDSIGTLGNTVVEQVLVGIVPSDGLHDGQGVRKVSPAPVRVDNNDPPRVEVDALDFLQNRDRRGGIPIPFEVQDPNGDEVSVVFQWRKPEEPFPELPGDVAGIRALLTDPEERARLHIATERPRVFEGRITLPVAGTDPEGKKARLTEVASTASLLLYGGLEGRELEVLRASIVPAPAAVPDLSGPVAAKPLGDGRNALVLDRPAEGRWRLRELELAGGTAVREIAGGAEGDPSALALEPGERFALVALDQAGTWRVLKVDLGSAAAGPSLILTSGAGEGPGPVRGLELLGTGAALATVGDKLLRLDFPEGVPARAVVLLRGLKTPWGLARDPAKPRRVYVAERDGPGSGGTGRILSVDLDTLATRALPVKGAAIERPESIALESRGRRLLVLSARSDGLHDLKGLVMTSGMGAESFPILSALPGSIGEIAAGPEGLRLLALTAQNDLAVGGGLVERRRIERYEPLGQVVTVDRPFEPPLRGFERWRIADRIRPLRAGNIPVRDIFVWDTADVPQGGEVLLRAVPFDSEVGEPDDTVIPRAIDGSFTQLAPPLAVPTPQGIAGGDLNGDGLQDLVASSSSPPGISVFYQKLNAGFGAAPDRSLTGVSDPKGMAVADLDGDGLMDVACADQDGNRLAVYFQSAPGDFGTDAKPLLLAGPRGPRAVIAADLDGDGDLDLASANSRGGNVTVFLQGGQASRVFETSPELTLGTPQSTPSPSALAAGDFDADGDLDLAATLEGANASALGLFFQKSPGLFENRPLALGGPLVKTPQAVVASDLNGDGLADLVVASQPSKTLSLFFQGADGLTAESAPLVLSGLGGPRALVAEDLDRDGDVDLAAADWDGNRLAVFFAQPGGAYSIEPDVSISGLEAGERPLSLATADFDGDGLPDLAAASGAKGRVVVYGSRDSFSSWEMVDDVLNSTLADELYVLQVADVDDDGDLDVVTAYSQRITVNLQGRTGGMNLEPDLSLTPEESFESAREIIKLMDVDGDGRLDLAFGDSTGFITIIFEDGKGLSAPGAASPFQSR